MSDTLFNAELAPTEPQLHVLLVGISEYRHLNGGPEFDATHPPKRTFGLGQLTSPGLSASALADWFLAKHDNPDTPLGTIELLLSPPEYVPTADAAAKLRVAHGNILPVPLATLDQIKQAARRWFDRLHVLRENIGVFYFCDHGLEAGDRYLLAADFAGAPENLDHGIINFQQTFRHMRRCKASTQCFLLDACRDSPEQLRIAASQGSVGRPVIDPRGGPELGRNAPIYHAAAPEKPAFGPPGEKSYFARAVLDCLNGMAARAGGDPRFYSIDHASLALALPEYVNRLAEEHELDLRCHTDGGDAQLPDLPELHRTASPVDVLTTIFCRPREAHMVAQLAVIDAAGKATPRTANGPKPWRLTLRSGKHTVSATFAQDALYSEQQTDVIVVPTPLFSVPVPIQPRAPVRGVGTGGSRP